MKIVTNYIFFEKKKEFMGRTFVKPFVNKDKKHVPPPKLKWYKIFCNSEHSGDILASFELILLNDVSEN
jgi:hypothetical protein